MPKNSRGKYSGAKYRAAWRQRRNPALAILVLGPLAGYALARALPARFASVARLEWKGAQPAAGGVEGEGAQPSPPNLAFVEGRVLTAERLAPVIAKHGLYFNEAGETPGKDPVERMRRDLSIKPAENGFSVSFSAHDARLAQAVCQGVVALFLEAYQPVNAEEHHTDTRSLAAQAGEAKRKLDQQESRLNEFRRRHTAELDSGGSAVDERNLMTLISQLADVRSSLERATGDKTLSEALLRQELADWHRTKAPEPVATQALEQELAAKQAQLAGLETRYTRDHPDVVKLRNDISQLQKKLDAAKAVNLPLAQPDPNLASPDEPAQITETRAQIHRINLSIQEKTHERQRLEQEIQLAEARRQKDAGLERELVSLSSSHDAAQSAYESLAATRKKTEPISAAAQQDKATELRVIDPPSLPAEPAFPSTLLFSSGGLGCGILLGFVLILAGAWSDTTLRTTEDVERYLGLPTLAIIPTVGADHDRNKPGTRDGGRRGNPGTREESVLVDV